MSNFVFKLWLPSDNPQELATKSVNSNILFGGIKMGVITSAVPDDEGVTFTVDMGIPEGRDIVIRPDVYYSFVKSINEEEGGA